MLQRQSSRKQRRGVALLVVLALLTLFAVVAITFVYFSEGQTVSTDLYLKAQPTDRRYDQPEVILGEALKELVWDGTGRLSSARTHGLATNMYGDGGNIPFNGSGRVHVVVPGTLLSPPLAPNTTVSFDAADLINFLGRAYDETSYGSLNPPYTYPDHNHAFLGAINGSGHVLARSFVRPVLLTRTADGASFDFNPYDPDHYSFWLVRPGPLSTPPTPPVPGTSGWENSANLGLLPAQWVYRFKPPPPAPQVPVNDDIRLTRAMARAMVTRPGPWDHPNFPPPADAGGDVRNLPLGTEVVLPNGKRHQGNDSYWQDWGLAHVTAPNGKRYKPLVAVFISDLDGKINVNFAGNVRATALRGPAMAQAPLGPNLVHASNHGWGPWEINPGYALRGVDPSFPPPIYALGQPEIYEWPNLLRHNTSVSTYARYGTDRVPALAGSVATGFNARIRAFSPFDYDSVQPGGAGSRITTSSLLNPQPDPPQPTLGNAFPNWPTPGYENGDPTDPSARLHHPGLFPVPPYDLLIDASQMEALLRYGDKDWHTLTSDLLRLLPHSLVGTNPTESTNAARARRLITTHSADRNEPGVMPYLYADAATPQANVYQVNQANATTRSESPVGNNGNGLPFPAPPNTPVYNDPLGAGSRPTNPIDFVAGDGVHRNYRSVMGMLKKLDLNRYLRPYPHQGVGGDPAGTGYVAVDSPVANLMRFDDGGIVQARCEAATRDRQAFAEDLYRRLVAVTGVAPPADPANPTDDELMPRRWLAQLAVNIVDFIDEDDIATPFNFYSRADVIANGGDPTGFNVGRLSIPGDPEWPTYWVFGTELPRVVLNEALAEVDPPANGPPGGNQQIPVRVWTELLNTAPIVPPNNRIQATDYQPTPLFVPANGMAQPRYSPYRVQLTNEPNPDVMRVRGNFNDNVRGTPIDLRRNMAGEPCETTDDDFDPAVNPFVDPMTQAVLRVDDTPQPAWPANPAYASPYVDRSEFFLIGPPSDTRNNALQDNDANNAQISSREWFQTNSGTPPPWLKSPRMEFRITVNFDATGSLDQNDFQNQTRGYGIVLRRLANPHLPPNDNPSIELPAGSGNWVPNPDYNPYVTVDYKALLRDRPNAVGEAIYDVSNMTPNSRSRGKTQPYASAPFVLGRSGDAPTDMGPTDHTFGWHNVSLETPSFANQGFNWLVHLDRQLISPMELLHVSGFKPHQLTQRFLHDVNNNGIYNPGTETYQHLTNTDTSGGPGNPTRPFWTDRGRRLHRFLEFVQTDHLRSVRGETFRRNLAYLGFNPAAPLPALANVFIRDDQLDLDGEPGYFARYHLVPGQVIIIDAGTPNEEVVTIQSVQHGPVGAGSTIMAYFQRPHGPAGLVNVSLVSRRMPAKINVNTLWDPEPLRALADPNNPGSGEARGNNFTINEIDAIFALIMANRQTLPDTGIGDPNMPIGRNDKPFMPFTAGHVDTNNQFPSYVFDPNTGTTTFMQGGMGTNATLFRANPLLPNNRLLFDASALMALPTDHPYHRSELLNKIYNNVTTRSNVFAVWLTVGYFELGAETITNTPIAPGDQDVPVADLAGFSVGDRVIIEPDTPREEVVQVMSINPMTKSFRATFLGGHNVFPIRITGGIKQEAGLAEGRHRRHRMFAIVDRSVIDRFYPNALDYSQYDPRQSYSAATNAEFPVYATAFNTIVVPSPIGAPVLVQPVPPGPIPPGLQPGHVVLINVGQANEEAVRVESVAPNGFYARCRLRREANGNPVPITIMGYPGVPRTVLHWSLIE